MSDVDGTRSGRRGISRNRYVVESCRTAAAQDEGEWPAGFFDLDPGHSIAELQEAVDEMEGAIRANRSSRGAALL